MSQITILKETAPTRCEICHQADCYDATTNHCSRCGNINLSFNTTTTKIAQSLMVATANYQLVKPDTVELVDAESNYLITYKWHSFKNKNRSIYFLVILAAAIYNLGPLAYKASPLALLFLITMALPFLLIFIRALINKTTITLTNTKLLLNDSPISLFRDKEIALADIREVFCKRSIDDDILYVKLKNGKKIRLIKNIYDRDSLLFIEKILKEKIKHLN